MKQKIKGKSMFESKTLEKYSELVLKVGVNLQANQGLEIACPIELKELALALTEKAYKLGAKVVNVRWACDEINKLTYENASISTLTDVPKHFVDSKNYLVKKDFCYVAIAAEDPSIFKDIPSEKLASVSKARGKALKRFSDAVMANKIRWCVVSAPTLNWAKQIFPSSQDAENKLCEAIATTMRLNEDDPVKSWRNHIARLNNRAKILNEYNFEYLRFENAKGTNIEVGLCDDHVWLSAKESAQDGIDFVANMPTEEVFTAPHNKKINGIVKSSLPLSYNGQIIDNFSLTFKNGKIIDFSAQKGYELLKSLIETDKGTFSLGEVALIGKNSPVCKTGILFYNTLFDENASCHFAIGKAYPTTVKNGEQLNTSELKRKGVNSSIEHVDFMIGTEDLSVIGKTFDNKEITIFENGDWVF